MNADVFLSKTGQLIRIFAHKFQKGKVLVVAKLCFTRDHMGISTFLLSQQVNMLNEVHLHYN